MKRVLIAALLVSLLMAESSCGNTDSVRTDTGTDTQNDVVQTDVYSTFERKTFAGRKFTIFGEASNNPGDTLNGEVINDVLYQRNIDISQEFDVDIQCISYTDSASGAKLMKNSVLSGDKEYNIYISCIKGGDIGTLATDGVLANLCDVPYLSLTENWWSHMMYDSLRLGGKMFYTSGDISPKLYGMSACVFLNNMLLDQYKIDTDFYSLVYDGKWTIDELTKFTKDLDIDINDDGIMHTDNDFFGFIHQTGVTTINMMLVGCGLKLSETDKDGNLAVNLNSEKANAVFEKISKLKRNVKYVQQDDTINKAFRENRAVSMLHLTYTAVDLRDMETDFSILPVPKYDDNQKEYCSLANPWTYAFVAIPNNADLDFTGCITEALARYSFVNMRPLAYDVTMKQKGTRDEDSANMIDIICNSAYLDYSIIQDFGSAFTKLADAIVNDKPTASVIASTNAAMLADMQSFAEAWNENG